MAPFNFLGDFRFFFQNCIKSERSVRSSRDFEETWSAAARRGPNSAGITGSFWGLLERVAQKITYRLFYSCAIEASQIPPGHRRWWRAGGGSCILFPLMIIVCCLRRFSFCCVNDSTIAFQYRPCYSLWYLFILDLNLLVLQNSFSSCNAISCLTNYNSMSLSFPRSVV